MITVKERILDILPHWRKINVQNDKNAEKVKICCPRYYNGTDLSQYSMYLKTISQGGRDDILLTQTVSADTISAQWTLCPPQTSYNGTLVIQLYFSGTNFKWETKPAEIEIIRSEDASTVVPATPSAYTQWLSAIQEIADDAETAKEAIEDMTATASVDSGTGSPSVVVTKSTVSGHENLDFAFHNLGCGGGGTSDHTQLSNRDAVNQHPISAITDLQSTLGGKADVGDSYTKAESDAKYLTSHQDVSGKENNSNKVTSLSSASTNTQYPSAKCVYDLVGNIESLLEALL